MFYHFGQVFEIVQRAHEIQIINGAQRNENILFRTKRKWEKKEVSGLSLMLMLICVVGTIKLLNVAFGR